MSEYHPLEKLSRAWLEPEDFANGVEGEQQFDGHAEGVRAILLFIEKGWKRDPDEEGYSNLPNVAFRKGKLSARVTLANCMGPFTTIEVGRGLWAF